MKILHVAETVKGGVASVLVPLVMAQVAEKHAVKVIVPGAQRGELKGVNSKNILIFERDRRGISGLVRLAVAVVREVWVGRPQVVHLHSTFAGLVGRLVVLGLRPWRPVKVVYCPHGWAFSMRKMGMVRGCYVVVEKLLSGVSDAIVCVGAAEWDAARAAGLPEKKLVLVHNGVAKRKWVKKPVAKGKVRALFVGRFDRQKGFDVVLDAMRLLESEKIELVAVGEALDGSRPPARPNVRYTGWLDTAGVMREMEAAEVLVMASRWEGFAMVPLEAMSHGLAVVGSDIGPLREVVRHGETGLLVPVDDAAALAEVLQETPRADWRAMGEAGYKRAMRDFTVDKMVAGTMAVYKKVLG
jgi:glycosyltransferase involved in cell wall biosynthesis